MLLTRWSRLAALVGGLAAPALFAAEGVVLVQKALDLAEGGERTAVLYIEPERVAMQGGQGGGKMAFAYLADENLMRVIDHDQKSYREFTGAELEQLAGQVNDAMAKMQQQLEKLPPEQRAMMEKMMKARLGAMAGAGQAEPEKTVYRKTGESGSVEGWECDYYEGTRGGQKAEVVCATDWQEFNVEPSDFQIFRKMGEFIGKIAPGADSRQLFKIGDEDWEANQGFPGVPVERILYRDGQAVEQQRLEELRREEIPADVYAAPSGYKREALGQRGR